MLRPGAACLAACTAAKVVAAEIAVALGVPWYALRAPARLQGMADRVEAIGGSLEAFMAEAGFEGKPEESNEKLLEEVKKIHEKPV